MAKSFFGKVVNAVRAPIPFESGTFDVGRTLLGYGGRGRTSQLQQMGATGTLYSVVQLLSTGTSAHQWELFRKSQDTTNRYSKYEVGYEDREQVTQHQALKLWNRPNDFMTGEDFREIGWQYMELVGEWPIVLSRGPSGRGVPTEMWPVRPDRMEPVPDRNKFLLGWIYTGPNGEQVPLSHEEVIFLKYPDPNDVYRGLSAIQSLLLDIDSAKYTAAWSRNFFLNSATPGGIVQFSKRLSDEEFKEFTTRWRDQHQGVARGHRVGVLEQGAVWFPNTYTIREMQFVELRTMAREIIREAYRIHKAMLGLSDDVNRANAETAQEVHIVWHEIPRLKRMRGMLNTRYLEMFGSTGKNVEFDYCNPIPQSRESSNMELQTKANAAAVLTKAGYDGAHVLKTVGLPDMDYAPPQPAIPRGNPAPAPRPALPGYEPDQPPALPAGPTNLWEEVDDQQLLEMSYALQDAFVIRNGNGRSKEDA
jgi:HK97 family phage portal protein